MALAASSITIAEINTAIANTLRTATGLTEPSSVQDAAEGELTDDINDPPTLQVYWAGIGGDARSRKAAQTTFGGAVIIKSIVFRADLYVQQLGISIAEEMEALYPLIDAIVTVLESTQQSTNYFGSPLIKGIERWAGDLLNLKVSDDVTYVGARFTITLLVG